MSHKEGAVSECLTRMLCSTERGVGHVVVEKFTTNSRLITVGTPPGALRNNT